ncbi:MAG: protein translocase subunit SecD, partial [Spongiibacteraceae bacterium]|nr:protein translocase subunit SecD [Spongiibacteraceae bacterium]
PDTREPVVNFSLNSQGGARFADITRANIGRAFAIVLDDEVITAPVIRTAIGGGSGQISGGFTAQSAADLALLLRAGALPAPLSVVEERTVGPDLGADAIRMGVQTGSLGAALTLAFMVLAYGRWGMIANAALLAYAVLVVAVLVTLGATLTLPGIAGLILSLGMAVDANILINERIREETRRGASARFALQQGFERAFGTILDSNVTTLIAVGLLFMFGTGPVRGFAVAMAVGLSVSLFTSVAVTRLLMEWRVRAAPRQPLVIGGLRWLDSIGQAGPIPFMKARGWGLVLSALLSLGSLLLLWQPGLNAGIDFEGGTLVEVRTAVPGNTETLRAALSRAGLDSVAIQAFGDDHGFLMRLPVQAGSQGAVETVRATLREASPGVQFPRVEVVGPSVSGGFFDTSVLAVILAGIGMFGYLWLRFERYFAVGAMLTLALDLTKTLGFFALTGLEFNLTAVAALLALIGYSVNDKVVVFDRIRENLRAGTTKPLRELIDESLTSTLTRTLFTSLTTFLALLPMGVAGGAAVASFALPLLFGVVVGTSSSILIAAPIVLVLGERAMLAAQQARSTPRATDDTLFLQEDRP